jgi:hypothetical protein
MKKQQREGGRGYNSKKEGDAHMLEEESEDHSDALKLSRTRAASGTICERIQMRC